MHLLCQHAGIKKIDAYASIRQPKHMLACNNIWPCAKAPCSDGQLFKPVCLQKRNPKDTTKRLQKGTQTVHFGSAAWSKGSRKYRSQHPSWAPRESQSDKIESEKTYANWTNDVPWSLSRLFAKCPQNFLSLPRPLTQSRAKNKFRKGNVYQANRSMRVALTK